MYKIADSHNDFIAKLPPNLVRSFLFAAAKECDVELITAAVCSTDMPLASFTAQSLSRLLAPLEGFKIDTKVGDAKNGANFEGKNPQVLVELEGLCYLNKNNLNILDVVKPFAVTLTWNNDNSIAGGCRSGTNMGVSPFGYDVIDRLKARGIAIDTAHLNRKSFFDIIDSEGLKIYNSHTCVADIFSDDLIMERNITGEQAGLVINRGGFVGITLIPYFLCGNETKATAEDVFRHIDFIAEHFGTDNLGIGSDFFGADNFPEGLADYYGYQSIIKIMQNHGYNEEAIQNILCDNYVRFVNS